MHCVHAQSYPTLCNPMDCSLPDSSVHGIFPGKNTKVVSISYSRDLPNPEMELISLASPALAGGFFTTVPHGKPLRIHNIPFLSLHCPWDHGLSFISGFSNLYLLSFSLDYPGRGLSILLIFFLKKTLDFPVLYCYFIHCFFFFCFL